MWPGSWILGWATSSTSNDNGGSSSQTQEGISTIPASVPPPQRVQVTSSGPLTSTIDSILGQDFGNITSKCSLAYKNQLGRVQLLRVNASVGISHQERIRTPYASTALGQFCSYCYLDIQHGRLVPGREAFKYEERYSLKTSFAHRAGLAGNTTIKLLVGGEKLLLACDTGKITPEMEEDAIVEHLTLLRDQVVGRADINGLTVAMIVLSHPSYLTDPRRSSDLDKYRGYYLGLMRPIWAPYEIRTGVRIEIGWISEGQGTANYICEDYDDQFGGFDRAAFWANFTSFDRTQGINFLICDQGSSTMNPQVQTVYFDERGNYDGCQSNDSPGWPAGSLGGSHTSNDAAEVLLRKELAPSWSSEAIVNFLDKWEQAKSEVDPDRRPLDEHGNPKGLRLGGEDPRSGATLTVAHLQWLYQQSYGSSLRAFGKLCLCLFALGKDFAVVCSGGSFHSPYLVRVVGERVSKLQRLASGAAKPFNIRHALLTEYDTTWPSAVASGIAVAGHFRPHPEILLRRSALGMQVVRRYKRGVKSSVWVGSTTAEFLLGKGGSQTAMYENSNKRQVLFRLVVDPNHWRLPAREQQLPNCQSSCPPIHIGEAKDVLNGPRSVYDLDFEADGKALPQGFINFSASVQHLGPSTASSDEPLSVPPPAFILRITCYKIDPDSGERLKDDRDRRWDVTVVTDLGSKHLQASQAEQLPVWCAECTELISMAYSCPSCPDHHLCDGCYDAGRGLHDASHGHFTRRLIGEDIGDVIPDEEVPAAESRNPPERAKPVRRQSW